MIKNLPEFLRRLNKHAVKNPEKNAKKLITEATLLVRNSAVSSILRDPKTGQIYGNHVASAAGEAPASDTGFLASNITFDVNESSGEVVGYVTSAAPYSAALEFGTRNIAPRPFMQPALESNIRKIERKFTKGGLIK